MRWVVVVFLMLWGRAFSGEFEISLTTSERSAITEIISTMGEKNIARLLLDSSRLTGLGYSIENVPPLQFLGFILTNAYLKDCLRIISQSYFKWPPFIDGFGNNMEKEIAEGRLFEDLPGFAKLVGGRYRQLEMYSQLRDWNQFVRSLL